MSRLVRLMQLGRNTRFVHEDEVRELVEPDGRPTGRQLMKLNALGYVAVVEPGQVEPLTKGGAAWLLDRVLANEAVCTEYVYLQGFFT
jgi:hypothetical protein